MSSTFTDNSAALDKKLEAAIKRALTMIGGTIETAAKERCPVDTGLLRNSITYALGGEPPHITEYTDKNREQRGSYNGTAPKDDKGEYSVYIGTNVQYAPYQELGTVKMPNGNPFIRPAIESNREAFKQIIQGELSGIA